jgi:DNA-binding CsgD family transcriptional regulator
MKQSSIIAYIQQLCRLGLGGQVIMPELVRALHELIPSRINCFLYADQQGRLANIYTESPTTTWSLPATSENQIARCLTCRFYKNSCAGLPDSEFFSEPWRPFNHQFLLNIPVARPEGVLGALQLYRCGLEQPVFSLAEQYQLRHLIPDIAVAVSGNRNQRGPFVENDDSARLVCSRAGEMLYMSQRAEELLFLASHPLVTTDRWQTWHCDEESADLVAKLCQRLTNSHPLERATSGSLQNNWGKFCFDVYWLEPFFSKQEPLIGITLKRQVPLALRLLEAIHAQHLSPRQKQVCMLLTYGCSNQTIAERLNLSPYTIADYVKAIYEKLEVHHRDQLLDKLKTYKSIEATTFNNSVHRPF